MAQSHPSDHRQHAKFSTSFASSSSSPSPAAAAANAANASPSPSSSDVLPPHPTTITNSQAFDVGASSPHHLHQFTNQCSTRPNTDDTPHMPSLFYLHHQHHQHEQKLPISHHHESHIQTESAHRMNNNNETVSTSAASKGIEQALRSYVHSGISSPPSAPPRYHGSVLGANITGVREQPISFLQLQEASNRFYPANSTNTLKGGFPPTHNRVAPHPLSNREEGPPNGISSRGPLNNDNDLFYTADSIQSSKGGLLPSDRPPYPLSNREEGSSTGIGISTPTNTDTDRNARLSAISHSHSRFKPNGSPSSHIDHHHHPRVALDIMSDHRENTTSFLPSTHSIPEIDVAPSGNLPSSFPLNRVPSIPSSVNVESGHELFHGASKSGLLLHGSSSLAGFLSRTNNDGSSSGNSSDEGSYEKQGRLPVAASAIHHQMKEPSTYFEGYTWDEAGNVMAGSANAAAPYNRKTFRDSDKYIAGPLLVDSQKGSTLGHSGLINHFTLGTTTSPESIYFTDRLSADSIPCRTRAKRGCATHPRSIAERVRRTKISERMKKLQELVPNMDKHTNTAEMLDEAVEYVKGLQHQVKELTEAQAKCSCSYSNTRKDQ